MYYFVLFEIILPVSGLPLQWLAAFEMPSISVEIRSWSRFGGRFLIRLWTGAEALTRNEIRREPRWKEGKAQVGAREIWVPDASENVTWRKQNGCQITRVEKLQ